MKLANNGKYTGKIVKLTPTDPSGSPEEFEKRFERRRQPRFEPVRQPKLTPIENKSMSKRMEEFGLGES